ncbi:MAG: DUF1648 domain-containing protein [Phenylobacterium sp.]|nr:MAG: DUF1648 domain-containing protein [Phenylobacterium sp.]
MNVRKQLLVSGGTLGAMLALAGLAWAYLPTQLAVRWDIHGDPAGYLDRLPALLIVPAIGFALTAFFALAPTLMPARSRLERSAVAWTAIWMVVLGNMLFSQILLVAANLGLPLDVARCSDLYAAVVIFVTGNWLGKLRHNPLFGLRTPWTVADERVWDKTHRFAGRLLVLAAVVLAAAGLLLPAGPQANPVLYALMIACAAGPALAAVIYSALITRPSAS